jgi:phosphatidylethanolamine/phosphatidyl-N-methylethanolamine N-methyltransferase
MPGNFSDTAEFISHWLSDPKRIGALAPSGTALAKLITAEISSRTAPVIELGPGTGVFTRALLQAGIAPRQLALIEYLPDFAAKLQEQFPQAQIVAMDAAKLGSVELFGHGEAGAVISGLPLLSMPARKVLAIIQGAFVHLRPSGALYQFTYVPRCPIHKRILDRLGLKAEHCGTAVVNFPPAFVYRIVRK